MNEQQLQALATQGKITPNTPLETDTGHKGLAGQIPGLTFSATTPPPFAQAAPPAGGCFCTNCGNPISEQAVACMSCGASPVGHRRFCRQCGAALNAEQVVCVRCGSPVSTSPMRNAPMGNYSGEPVSDHLVWSIITTLLCCMPVGIAAIVFSVMCKNDLAAGRYDSAARNSNIAFYCNIGGLVGGIIVTLLAIIGAVAGA